MARLVAVVSLCSVLGLSVGCGKDDNTSGSLSGATQSGSSTTTAGETTDATDTDATAGPTDGSGSDSSSDSSSDPTTDTTDSTTIEPTTVEPTTVEPTTVEPTTVEPTTNSTGGSCGDGVVDADEQCDGGDLNGLTCQSLGYDGGTLACDGITCTYDTSGCTTQQPTTG